MKKKEKTWTKVLNTWNKEDKNKEWFKITLDDGKTIEMTGNHKIWIKEYNKYIEVSQLFKDNNYKNLSVLLK